MLYWQKQLNYLIVTRQNASTTLWFGFTGGLVLKLHPSVLWDHLLRTRNITTSVLNFDSTGKLYLVRIFFLASIYLLLIFAGHKFYVIRSASCVILESGFQHSCTAPRTHSHTPTHPHPHNEHRCVSAPGGADRGASVWAGHTYPVSRGEKGSASMD